MPVANNLNTMPYMWQNSSAINALSAPYDVVERLEDASADLWTTWPHRYIDCCDSCDLRCPAIDKFVSSTIRACSGRLEMAWLICGLRGIHRYIDCCEICDLRCCSNRRSDLMIPRFEIISISTKSS